MLVQLLIGNLQIIAGVITFPNDCRLPASVGQMPINTIHADIELTADKPANVTARNISLAYGLPGLLPAQECARLISPKTVWVSDRALIHAVIGGLVDERTGFHTRRDGIYFAH